jgi:protein-disulfide isomerase
MRPKFLVIGTLTALVLGAGCRGNDEAIQKELAGIRQEVQAIRAQLSKQGAPGRARPPGPDSKKVYAVGVDGVPSVGRADAPLTVVMASEYSCPWCDKQGQTFAEIKAAYGDDVRFVYRPYVVHPDIATDASLAACAADRQGKFEAVHEALWRDVFRKRAFDRASVEKVAVAAGADAAKLRADMDGGCKEWLAKEQQALRTLGAASTPTFWINGRPFVGWKPLAELKPILDEELARARERIAAGTPAASYYADWVVKKGLPRVEG